MSMRQQYILSLPVVLHARAHVDQLVGFPLPFFSFCPLGIIDLSQVPHLPVLVPPSAGTPSSPMDRITYIPGGSTTFPGRPYTTSPISPGTTQFTRADSLRDGMVLYWFNNSFSFFFLAQSAPRT